MITIDKAILHVLDFHSGNMAYSEQEMAVTESVQTFLLKHIERALASQEVRPGKFYDDSAFLKEMKEYLSGTISFIEFSQKIAKSIENAFLHVDQATSMDIIILDIHADEKRKLIIFKSNPHMGFTHQVNQTESGIKNQIINQFSIMPSISQKMDEFAVMNFEEKDLLFLSVSSKKHSFDGEEIYVLPEIVLECSLSPSQKDALKVMKEAASIVAENYDKDPAIATAAMKNYVAEHMEISDELDLKKAGEEVFKEEPAMQADYNRAIEEDGFHEPVKMNQEATLKQVSKHKLKTDTGIELTIPTNYFDNTEFIEFNNNEDGTLSITLKHIGSIKNK